ncbi:hypothetical protein E2P81_ATG11583 [Venturia nashicola]|uniref:Uncharacterized protein n=1 Tax=Venturia nashicola TaxID=86259 RepID=A0A4Z1NXM8_9PEZI|nr:hypothetical protein E6O75_ATG11275 [Venturia nashicola]TLD18673.1 hypothetical protein E2P81_ATG11583 [Venturia nashicola]
MEDEAAMEEEREGGRVAAVCRGHLGLYPAGEKRRVVGDSQSLPSRWACESKSAWPLKLCPRLRHYGQGFGQGFGQGAPRSPQGAPKEPPSLLAVHRLGLIALLAECTSRGRKACVNLKTSLSRALGNTKLSRALGKTSTTTDPARES